MIAVGLAACICEWSFSSRSSCSYVAWKLAEGQDLMLCS